MKQVFTTITAQLKAKVPGLKRVERWNNQLGNESEEKFLKFPCCYIQLTNIKTSTISTGVQHGEGFLRLRFCDAGNVVESLKTFDVEEAAYLALQNYGGGPLLVGLDRANIDTSDDFGAVEVLVVDYKIKFENRARLDSKRNFVKLSGREVTTTSAPQ